MAELDQRIASVETQISGMQGEVLRLNTETLQYMQRFKILEETDKRHQDEIRSLYATQEVTKAMVTQILARFDSFETRLLSIFEQSTLSAAKERAGSQKEYLKFVTYVIGATLGAVVLYLFTSQ